MAQPSIIYGYIQGADWMSSDFHKLHRLNREVLGQLPETDPFPHLTREMFAVSGDVAPGPTNGKAQIIHFGTSMREVEMTWRKWLDKFEALLRKMYWFNAVVHLHAELVGDYEYEWTVDATQIVHFYQDPPRPTSKWLFDGGPRDFDL